MTLKQAGVRAYEWLLWSLSEQYQPEANGCTFRTPNRPPLAGDDRLLVECVLNAILGFVDAKVRAARLAEQKRRGLNEGV